MLGDLQLFLEWVINQNENSPEEEEELECGSEMINGISLQMLS